MTASGQLSGPPTGNFMAVSGKLLVSAVNAAVQAGELLSRQQSGQILMARG